MLSMSRRRFLQVTGGASAGLMAWQALAQTAPARSAMSLGYSTYGMKTLTTEKALEVIHQTGFDAVEITVRADWDAAPARMSAERRAAVRDILKKTGLRLSALMEHLYPSEDDKGHRESLERLRGVYQLARDLAPHPDQPPVVQTVLGDGDWEKKKSVYVDRVGDWAKLGQSLGVITCVKPHRGGAMSQPSEAVWLIKQLDSTPWLRMVYDYSHYAFRNIPLLDSLRDALPFTAHVAVKDTVQDGERFRFVLPGEAGTIDYVTILKTLHEGGYRGDINCEVSGMVWSKADYNPLDAVAVCHRNLTAAFEKAGVPHAP